MVQRAAAFVQAARGEQSHSSRTAINTMTPALPWLMVETLGQMKFLEHKSCIYT